jgi:hypothetical protein
MTKYELEDLKKRNIEAWEKYYGGSDVDLAQQNGVPDEPEFYVTLTRQELDEGFFFDKVVIEVDKLTHYEHGTLRLILPETIGGQNENTHQPVSGVIYKDGCGIPKGCRVFFHYLCIINAKLQKSQAGLFVICDNVPYLVLDKKHIYMGIIDGKPISLNPDFCITEPIERENIEVVEAPDGMKFIGTMSGGGILIGEEQLKTKTYEPYKCTVVSLPSKDGMEWDRLEAFEKIKTIDGVIYAGVEVKEGDTVVCRRSWDLPLGNGIQDYLGGKKYFRTRMNAILEIL